MDGWWDVMGDARQAYPQVATVVGRLGHDDLSEHNAHLVAAAPDLLKRLWVRVNECPCVGDSDFTNQQRCLECIADLAAIAKAEGR